MDRWEEIYGSRHGTRSSSWKCCNRCDITVVVAGGRKQMDAVLATLSSDEALSGMSICGLSMNLYMHARARSK